MLYEYILKQKIDMETLALLFASIGFLILLTYWHVNNKVQFDLKTLFIDNTGKLSLSKFGQVVALFVSTWIIINETQYGRITDWLFFSYMAAWAGANSLNKYLDKKSQKKEDKPKE